MFERLLVSTDFSDGLYRLVNCVPSLVATGLKQIVFLHSVPIWDEGGIPRVDQEKVDQAKQRLSTALETVPEGVEVFVEVLSGRPVDAILETVQKYQSDLVLLGMPSRSLLNEKLFGSTTIGLCQKVKVPLMILRPQLMSTFTEAELDLRCRSLFRYLLIPYDGSDSCKYLVEVIRQKATQQSLGSLECCMLCWVVEPSGRRSLQHQSQLEDATASLEAVKADLETLGLRVTSEVRQGNPIVEIQALAEVVDINAIAISSKNFGNLRELSVPSFAGEILRRSWHPVLFFPPQR
jgi:nucleotide-binding universal stress UspA family protein